MFRCFLDQQAFEIIERDGRYFARYDAGTDQVACREDEISSSGLTLIESGQYGISRVRQVLHLLHLALIHTGPIGHLGQLRPNSSFLI